MFNTTRVLIISLFVSATVVACNSEEATQSEASSTAPVISISASDAKIEVGTSKQAMADLLGSPTISQTHTIDSLTVTHSEWTDESGTLSVQFHNDKAQFHQFIASPSQD